MSAAETDAKFIIDRDAFYKRVTEDLVASNQKKAVYTAHMGKVAHHLYAAGEAVKAGEFGHAQAEHRIADPHLSAARKLLPEL